MIGNMVKGSRYSRARAISDRSVIEFKILNQNPLVTYCLIQGSAPEPYIVFIDLKKNVVGHYCPDFAKGRGWCKHLGKLLLMLDEKHVKAINDNFRNFTIINMQSNVNNQIDKYKQHLLKTNGADEDITLENQIKILDNMMMQNQKIGDIIPAILSSIKKELSKIADNLILFRLNLLISGIPSTSRKLTFEKIQKPLLRAFSKATAYFTKNFWIQSTPKRLEQAYMINDVSYALTKPFSISKITFPENLVEQEKIDASLILKVLLRDDQKAYFEVAKKLGLDFANEVLGKRAERILSSIKISSTVIPQLESWLQTQVTRKYSSLTRYRDYNDLLIYLMKTAGETVNYHLKSGNRSGGMTSFPVTLLEENPCLNFIIEHIKESEREYLLSREIQNSSKFFDWLAGKKVDSVYVENPRSRALESSLKKNGIIIQWDINLNKKFREQFQAYQGSQRFIIDPTSPINSIIQPFDYTLCIPQMKKQSNGTKTTYPQQILLPDQVIKLVLQGVPIISNVLRWEVISKFVNEGYLSGGDVLASIAHSEKMNFIYGSFELVKALEEIVILGKAGLTDNQFLDYQKKLKKESSGVNAAVRGICREFIQSEGKQLQAVLDMLKLDANEKLRLVVNGIKNTNSIAVFRKYIVRSITKSYFNGTNLEKTFFSQIETLQHSHYYTAMDVVSDQLSVYYINMENVLLGKTPTRKQVYENPLGKILIEKLNFQKVGDFSDTEKFEIYLNLVKIRSYFVVEEEKKSDPKTQKQLLTDLIYQSSEGEFRERIRIITQICLFNNNRSLDFLRDLLADKDERIRDIAFIALQFRNDKELRNHLKELLEHQQETVRESSITNMLKLRESKVFDYVLNAMKNESTMVRRIALRSLVQSKFNQDKKLVGSDDDKIYNCFISCLEDQNENIKNTAIDNIIREPFEITKDILFKALDNDSQHVRKVASEQLNEKGDSKLVKNTLMKAKDDKDTGIRAFALKNISLKKYAEAPKLIETAVLEKNMELTKDLIGYLLSHDIPKQNLTTKTIQKIIEYHVANNLEFNKEVTETLKDYGDDIVPFLIEALDNKDYKRKDSVVRFLEFLNTKKAVEQIIKLKDHDDYNLRIFNLDYIQRNRIQDSIKEIVENALNDKNPEVAFKAVQVYLVGNITIKNYSKNFVKAALRTYTEKNMSFAGIIFEKLSKLGDQVIDNIDIILNSNSINTKLSSIKLLVEIDSKDAIDKIIELLNHDDEIVKREAYDNIIWIDHPEARSIINKALKEKDQTIRRMAIQKFLKGKIAKANITDNLIKALVTTPITGEEYAKTVTLTLLKVHNKALPIIESAFKTQPLETKRFLTGILAQYDTKESKNLISKLFKDKDQEIRLYSMNFTRANNKTKLKEVLDKAVEDKDPKIRDVALRSLTDNIPVLSYSDKLIRLLVQNFLKKNDLPASRAQAALRKIGKKTIPFLLEGLASDHAYVVRYSAEILGDLKATEATDLIVPLLTNSEVQLRRSAAYSLRKIKNKKAEKIMIDSLHDNDLYVRRSLIKGLGDMKSTKAIPILKNMKKDEAKQKYPDKITIGMIDEALLKMK